MADSNERGKAFEAEVAELLQRVATKHPSLASVCAQVETKLRDGRTKVFDFTFQYETLSTRNVVAIECQDRDRFSMEIIDKILAARNATPHNRFWYVYREPSMVKREALAALEEHGILHFTLDALTTHLDRIAEELALTEQRAAEASRRQLASDGIFSSREKPVDRAMTTGSSWKWR